MSNLFSTTILAGVSAIALGIHQVIEGNVSAGLASIVAGIGLIREAMRPD